MRSTANGLLALLWLTSPLAAQDHVHDEQLGRVSFTVSCSAPAQSRFERAMSRLHSFWWETGEAAFSEVIAADSSCAMAYWGIAVNHWGNPFAGGPGQAGLDAGARAAQRAAELGAPTTREAGFIAAAAALYRDHETVRNPERLQAYSDTLARVYADHPEDVEVAIYYALSLVATASATDTTFERQRRAAAILNPLFAKHPQHPGLAHYIIHAFDSPKLASLGLEAARRYAQIAPSSPHAQHMPSHIFIRLGLWEETILSNRRSFNAGVSYLRSKGLSGVAPHEFHALDYMVYGYLQRGLDYQARGLVTTALNSTVNPPSSLIGNYNRTALEARLPLERSDWAAAARLPVRADSNVPVTAMLSRFARGLGAARRGDTARAAQDVAALVAITADLTRRHDAYWARVADIKRQAVQAWVSLARGDTAAAIADARAAAESEDVTEKHPVTPGELLPARELLGDLLLAIGRHDEARQAYVATLEREPGRARSMFGAARAAELAGDTAAARTGYAALLKQVEWMNSDRAELLVARRGLASRN